MATGHGETPRRRRTIYHNDARHYYLWVFESDPLDLHDAHRPVDEVAGTGVTTFSCPTPLPHLAPLALPTAPTPHLTPSHRRPRLRGAERAGCAEADSISMH